LFGISFATPEVTWSGGRLIAPGKWDAAAKRGGTMPKHLLLRCSCLAFVLFSQSALAWFIWVPTGLIARALETDPDTITVSTDDRALGKCAGLHVNQARKFSAQNQPYGDQPGGAPPPPESGATKFHQDMAELSVERAADKENVKKLGDAYSTRWSRVASADPSP